MNMLSKYASCRPPGAWVMLVFSMSFKDSLTDKFIGSFTGSVMDMNNLRKRRLRGKPIW
jgi:hypothetical protein